MNSSLVIRKFRRNLRDYGLSIAVRKAFGALLMELGIFESRVYRVYRIDLRTYEPPPSTQTAIQYQLITANEDRIIRQIESMEDWLLGSMARRLREGGICLVALKGRKLVGFNQVSFGQVEVPLVDSKWTFRPHYAWSDQITVHPDYRGQGIAAELRYRIFAELKRRGVTRFYGGALAFNQPSLKLARKVGFQEIADIHYRKVLSFRTRNCTRLKSCP